MKIRLLLLSLICSATFSAHAGACPGQPSPETTLKAIQLYRDDPMGDKANCALSIVANFAEQSSSVLVVIRTAYFPWWKLRNKIAPNAAAKLMGAFVAGNVEYQIRNKIREHRPIEGVQLQLLTYERMKEAGAIETLPEFEMWLKLERDGQLNSQLKE